MENIGLFMVRHPTAVGIVLAALTGYGAFNAYRIGRQVEALRFVAGESARAASEALGG